MMVVIACFFTESIDAATQEQGSPSDGDHGESLDADYPCGTALHRPIGKNKRQLLTATQISRDKLLNSIVYTRAATKVFPDCKVTSYDIKIACAEWSSEKTDKTEYEYGAWVNYDCPPEPGSKEREEKTAFLAKIED